MPYFSVHTLLFFALIIISLMVVYILLLAQRIKSLNDNTARLYHELQDMDNQAKLIIQSDIELKLYQENVEDKLKKLTLLRRLISSSINILDADELFSKIDEELINNIGFRKSIIMRYSDKETVLNINFTLSEEKRIKEIAGNLKNILSVNPILSYNLISTNKDYKYIIDAIGTNDFLIAPINMGTELYAVFVLAKCILPSGITAAEREILSIMCMYLDQCLDNIRLFESLYHAGEELESKVKEKTFQLTKSIKEIKEISKLKSEFISGVSHELRTPLTSIKGFSSLLVAEKFGTLPPRAKEKLQKIDSNVNKLVSMVNTLLDMSRIESKRMEINIVPADVVKLAKDTGDFLMPQIDSKNIHLNFEMPEALNVYMDKNLIERVFINIINNAIKFTPEGGTITIKCGQKDEHAVIAIKDTGYGMAKDDCDKIFQEFYRAKNALNLNVKGTGLGLSLVKRILNAHGERIWVESELNKGTTFYFTLKVKQ